MTAELRVDDVLDEIELLGVVLAEPTMTAPAVTFRGNPSDTEIAAVLAVLAAASAQGIGPAESGDGSAQEENLWGTPSLIIRRRLVGNSGLVNAAY